MATEDTTPAAVPEAPVRLRRSLTTRQGRKVPRMLYRQQGPEPADDDPIVGLVDTPELAALIVAAVNRDIPAGMKVWIAEKVVSGIIGGNDILGVYSTRAKARAACQQDCLDSWYMGPRHAPALQWKDAIASAGDHTGYWTYIVTEFEVDAGSDEK